MPRALAFEGARRLQDEVVAMPRSDDLHAHRQLGARQADAYRRRRMPRQVEGDGERRDPGEDLRATEPIRIVGLVDPVPILFIHGEADTTTPVADARRLASAAGPTAELWTVPGAEHGRAHATEPLAYDDRVTSFLRRRFADTRDDVPIIGTQMAPAPDGRS